MNAIKCDKCGRFEPVDCEGEEGLGAYVSGDEFSYVRVKVAAFVSGRGPLDLCSECKTEALRALIRKMEAPND